MGVRQTFFYFAERGGGRKLARRSGCDDTISAADAGGLPAGVHEAVARELFCCERCGDNGGHRCAALQNGANFTFFPANVAHGYGCVQRGGKCCAREVAGFFAVGEERRASGWRFVGGNLE